MGRRGHPAEGDGTLKLSRLHPDCRARPQPGPQVAPAAKRVGPRATGGFTAPGCWGTAGLRLRHLPGGTGEGYASSWGRSGMGPHEDGGSDTPRATVPPSSSSPSIFQPRQGAGPMLSPKPNDQAGRPPGLSSQPAGGEKASRLRVLGTVGPGEGACLRLHGADNTAGRGWGCDRSGGLSGPEGTLALPMSGCGQPRWRWAKPEGGPASGRLRPNAG